MILSASRRTDIPAFYAEWFLRRVRAGYCEVPNPMNPTQVSQISLRPEDVDVVVFWTRSPRGMISRLPELHARGFRYYFHFTVCGYGAPIDAQNPLLATSLDAFKRLSSLIGPEKVIWRYDPIVFSTGTNVAFHRANFASIAKALRGYTRRCVVSVWDEYRKLSERLATLRSQGVQLRQPQPDEIASLIPHLVDVCRLNGMEIQSCAEELDLVPYGVRKGACIDAQLIQRVFHIEVCHQKDHAQRSACGCAKSRDIGMYNSCLFGCSYCYATTSFSTAIDRHRRHDPDSPTLVSATAS